VEKHESGKLDEKVATLMESLAAPFELHEVKFKPAVVNGNRALALAYVDARVIQDRLDDVLGVAGWQDEYECLPDGSVVCRLRLRLGAEWITKMDVGGPSEQPDEGDRRKAAFSDSLKRAAVKFGIGRYLYRLPQQWADYDPQKRQFVRKPNLPPNAIPQRKASARIEPTPTPAPAPIPVPVPETPAPQKKPARKEAARSEGVAASSREAVAGDRTPTIERPVTPTPTPIPEIPASKFPANGMELHKRLHTYDRQLAAQGFCQEGDLVKHVVAAGVKAGFEPDLVTWSSSAIQLAVGETRAFEARVRQPNKARDAA